MNIMLFLFQIFDGIVTDEGLLATFFEYQNTSAHLLSNLLNELGKRDKMPGLPSILSLFPN